MPEIPEVAAFGAYVKKHCLHKTISDVQVTAPRLLKKMSVQTFKKTFMGDQFSSVHRVGKYLIVDLKKSQKKLIMHFGLTGFLVYQKKHAPVRFSCIVFEFKDKSELHYSSIRKFGRILLLDSDDIIKEFKDLGPDPLELTLKQFIELIADNKKKKVKIFLMEQDIIAGIGNEYSDEILFQSGIDPRRTMNSLSDSEVKKLFKNMKTVLKYAIKLRMKYIEQMPEEGFFSRSDKEMFKSSYLQAHRHGDMLCPHNKNHKLAHIKINGRTAYFCPIDQK